MSDYMPRPGTVNVDVVRVESDSDDDAWTFTVQRVPGVPMGLPRAADVPADIRDALHAWLRRVR